MDKSRIAVFCVFIIFVFTYSSFAGNTLMDDALKYKKIGDWDNSAKRFMDVLKGNENCGECYFHLGEIEENKLDYEKASFFYKKASLLNPQYYLRLGYCYQTLMKWKESVTAFKSFLEKFPNNETAMEALGISYRKAGNLEMSEEIFKGVLKKNSGNAVALFNMSLINSQRGDKSASEKYLEQYKSVSEKK